MLATDHQREMTAHLEKTRCDVAVPRKFERMFRASGPSAPRPDDRRRYVRFHRVTKALLEIVGPTLSGIRDETLFVVLMVDVSKSGASFLHVGELYPGG